MKIPTIVRKPFRAKGSGSRLLNVGEVHEVDGMSQARLLHALGWIEKPQQPAPAAPKVDMKTPALAPAPFSSGLYRAEVVSPSEALAYTPQPSADTTAIPLDLGSDEAEESSDVSEAPRQKRAYRRRDLTAE